MGDMSVQHFTEISRYITCCDVYVRRYLWMRCYTNKHPLVKLYKDYIRTNSLYGMTFTFGLLLSVNNHDFVTYGPHASYSQVRFNSR